MEFIVREIIDKKEKERIARAVLNDLPEWFGMPQSTEQYIKDSQEKPFLASFYNKDLVGFVVFSSSSPNCAEIFVMGVKKEFPHHNLPAYHLHQSLDGKGQPSSVGFCCWPFQRRDWR